MSNLITLENISLHFGVNILLDKIKLQIDKGERVCLIGRNGAGKSSLLKIIEGVLAPDDGSIRYAPKLRIAKLAQELPQQSSGTVFEFVASGLAETGQLLGAYHALTQKLATGDYSQADLNELERLQHAIDSVNGWQFEQKIKEILSRLQLDADTSVSALSGGWQRRVALAQALVTSPELLLLDEPTNHLDIETIQWLEEQLISWNIGLLFITHDRSLLQRLATRIIELDRGHLTSWPGDYANFLRRKEEMLHAEAKQNSEFDKKLAQEEKWIRQGIQARRTRNEGRVRSLKSMREERSQRRDIQGKANITLNAADKSGNLVIEAKHITQEYSQKTIINDFSIRIMRGDRIGLIGPNGAGKSTLLNILLSNVLPQQGEVKQGTKLKIAYFDQLRATLEPEKTVIDNVAHSGDMIEINGKPRHIMSYLSDFLFTPARARTPVKALSGGECNRLLLAKLFTQPANLLVLDEPTNDLDIETLELLEELLCNYKDTLLIVSHDRAFLDNVVTSTLVFEDNGHIQEYVGGYNDWLRQRKQPSEKVAQTKTKKVAPSSTPKPSKKISYNEKKELERLPKKIEQLEEKQQALTEHIASEQFYQQSTDIINKNLAELESIANDLKCAYQRWEELEDSND